MKVCTLAVILFLTTAVASYADFSPFAAKTEKSSVKSATISGHLMVGKTPMINGVIFIYDKSLGPPPSFVKYWRIPDRVYYADKNGEFSIEVPEGAYYFIASQKDPDSAMGPSKVDEFNYIYGDAEKNPLPLTVKSGAIVNLGVLDSFIIPVNLQKFDKDITVIEGIVVDIEGKPLAGAVVFAYMSEAATGRPLFVSTRTEVNGKYQLRVHDGGTFYLKVRGIIGGGAPQIGEIFSKEPVMVTLKKDQRLKGITLNAEKFSRGTKGPIQ